MRSYSYTDKDPFDHSFQRAVMGGQGENGALLNKFINYDAIKRAATYIKKDYTTSDQEKLLMKLLDEGGNLIGYSTVEQFDFVRQEILQVIPAPSGWWVVSPYFPDGLGAGPLIGWRNCAPVFAGPDLSKRSNYPYAEDIAVLINPEGDIFSYLNGHMINVLPGQLPKMDEKDTLPTIVRKAMENLQK